jgi:CheY-like chemotaxis protein
MAHSTRSDVATSAVPSASAEPAASGQVESTNPNTAFRLLVVDDDATIRNITSTMLAEQGYEVLTAEDGQRALDLLPEFQPDLVVTDLRMPRMSGFELLKVLRERVPRIPVIAVSGDSLGDGLPASVVADAFFTKGGCYLSALGAKITQLLSGSARKRLDVA